MRKSLLLISLAFFAFVAFFVIDVWATVTKNPNTTY
jgi:hypothetical protein